MLRAAAIGTGIVTLGIALPLGGPLSPVAAAFVASWLAPRRKVAIGTLMSLVTVAMGVASCFVYDGGDFPGWRGAEIVAGLTLAWTLPACFVAAVVAGALSTKLGLDPPE